MVEFLSPVGFEDYELLDCGNFQKLERFGELILIRPEPQAVWEKAWSQEQWNTLHHIQFLPQSATSGNWKKKRSDIPDRWHIKYKNAYAEIKFRLALTSFKHVGIFPEQASNWDFISESIQQMKVKQPQVLNLFAYTGGASLIAKANGADVTHVDSIKQVITWSRENMDLSKLQDIRWVVEDALKFVKREVKRGKKYHGIILDPPAYGHGPNGEKWKLEDHIQEIMALVGELLDKDKHFLVLNTYSLGFSSLIVENLLKQIQMKGAKTSIGELYLHASSGVKLPLGVFGRIQKL
jgi:23S rRNA (cytosine1962-C5)-methyltransferase